MLQAGYNQIRKPTSLCKDFTCLIGLVVTEIDLNLLRTLFTIDIRPSFLLLSIFILATLP